MPMITSCCCYVDRPLAKQRRTCGLRATRDGLAIEWIPEGPQTQKETPRAHIVVKHDGFLPLLDLTLRSIELWGNLFIVYCPSRVITLLSSRVPYPPVPRAMRFGNIFAEQGQPIRLASLVLICGAIGLQLKCIIWIQHSKQRLSTHSKFAPPPESTCELSFYQTLAAVINLSIHGRYLPSTPS